MNSPGSPSRPGDSDIQWKCLKPKNASFNMKLFSKIQNKVFLCPTAERWNAPLGCAQSAADTRCLSVFTRLFCFFLSIIMRKQMELNEHVSWILSSVVNNETFQLSGKRETRAGTPAHGCETSAASDPLNIFISLVWGTQTHHTRENSCTHTHTNTHKHTHHCISIFVRTFVDTPYPEP